MRRRWESEVPTIKNVSKSALAPRKHPQPRAREVYDGGKVKPRLLRPIPRAQGIIMKSSPRLLCAIDLLATRKFTAASIAKADKRHPGVPLPAMVDDARMFALELKDTVSAIGKTIDGEDAQMEVIQQILAALG